MKKVATAWSELSAEEKQELQKNAAQANDARSSVILDQKEKEQLIRHYSSKISKMVRAHKMHIAWSIPDSSLLCNS